MLAGLIWGGSFLPNWVDSYKIWALAFEDCWFDEASFVEGFGDGGDAGHKVITGAAGLLSGLKNANGNPRWAAITAEGERLHIIVMSTIITTNVIIVNAIIYHYRFLQEKMAWGVEAIDGREVEERLRQEMGGEQMQKERYYYD